MYLVAFRGICPNFKVQRFLALAEKGRLKAPSPAPACGAGLARVHEGGLVIQDEDYMNLEENRGWVWWHGSLSAKCPLWMVTL